MSLNYMLLRLYRWPLFFLAGAFLSLYMFGYLIPGLGKQESIFKGLAQQSLEIGRIITFSLFALAVLKLIYNTYHFLKCYYGKGYCCDLCSGPVGDFRCLSCGRPVM